MSQKGAKLLALYAGLRSSEGVPISLKDLKLRVAAVPSDRRGEVLKAMAEYIEERSPENAGELRAARPGWGKRSTPGRAGVLQFIANMLGLAR